MNEGLEALSEREKETLRLLLAGHDAKSTARELGLSVHTINERLREARRKLGVSSSREAARLLGEAEQRTPYSLGDNDFGVAGPVTAVGRKQRGAGYPLAWLAGGMLIMSLVIAAVVLSSVLQGSGGADTRSAEFRPAAASVSETQSAAAGAAVEWVALVDGQRWGESWRSAAGMFRGQITADQWAESVRPVRQPLGAVTSRVLRDATRTSSLPGAPAGEYEVVEFRTDFAQKSDSVETVVMVREGSAWKVAGYFIR